MKVLVLGSLGFTGRNLFDHLKKIPNMEVIGIDRLADTERVDKVCDLSDLETVTGIMRQFQPEQIYDVAGSITNNYDECYVSNVIITKNILDAMLLTKSLCRLLLVGSSAEYGLVKAEDLPVKETQLPNPVSMYGLTKAYQSVLMGTYRVLHELDVLMVRPFNLIGKGISENLFPGRLQRSIEDLKAGKIEKIKTGSLAARRDYVEIEEALTDYMIVMERGVSGEIYNIGRGRSILLRDLLEKILKENGLDVSVVEEMSLTEKNKLDVSDMYADISKLEKLRAMQKR